MRNGAARPDGWTGLEGLLALREGLHGWARTRDGVLGALAFGSTERPGRPADAWSDLDLVLLVGDAAHWKADLSWTDEIAPSWLRFVHPAPIAGIEVVQVLFDGGYDVDLVPLDEEGMAALADPAVAGEVMGPGARVLRDDAACRLAGIAGAAAAPVPERPDRAEYDLVVATFLYQAVWATKRLRRGERWRAWSDLSDYMRVRLLRMLEWQAEARGMPGVRPEARGLDAWLPADMAARLPRTFAAYDDDSIASALPEAVALFGTAGREVAAAHGYDYPDDVEARVLAWVEARLTGREG